MLSISNAVQKDIQLGGLLDNGTKHFNSIEDALNEGYVPLNFSVVLRSSHSNKVLRSKTEEGLYLYYTNILDAGLLIHRGYDLLMYLSSIGVLMNVNYTPEVDNIMLKCSQFQPIGLCYDGIIDPIILSNVILTDEGIDLLEPFLKEGREVVSLDVMKNENGGNIQALLNEIKEVKINE